MITMLTAFALTNKNYIAGSGDGIVTVLGSPASRPLYLLDSETMVVLIRTSSLKNGRYIFMGLDSNKEYLVIARDDNKEFEPFAWDWVKSATDLDIDKLRAIL